MKKTSSNQGVKPIDQPNFSYWQALWMAFFSTRLYIDVIKRWKGFGFLYFSLLVLIVSLFASVHYIRLFYVFFDDEVIYPFEHMPLLYIQNGEAFIDKAEPYFVESKTKQPAIEINTTVEEAAFSPEKPSVFLLITKKAMYFRMPEIKQLALPVGSLPSTASIINTDHFDSHQNEVFDGAEWVKYGDIHLLKQLTPAFIFATIFGVFWGIYAAAVIILASIGRIISSVVLKYTVGFIDSFRLTVVAATAPLLVINALTFSGVSIHGGMIYFFLLVVFYFSMAIIAAKRESQFLVNK